MPLKRKIPSRKFASRKRLPNNSSAAQRPSSLSSRPFAQRSSAKSTSSRAGAQSSASPDSSTDSSTNSATQPSPKAPPRVSKWRTKSAPPIAEPAPPIAQCFWDMGFETLPTIEELHKRYRELSLVLHPDARGTKESFQQLRTTYETALTELQKRSPT